jgi:hypothetical protein
MGIHFGSFCCYSKWCLDGFVCSKTGGTALRRTRPDAVVRVLFIALAYSWKRSAFISLSDGMHAAMLFLPGRDGVPMNGVWVAAGWAWPCFREVPLNPGGMPSNRYVAYSPGINHMRLG